MGCRPRRRGVPLRRPVSSTPSSVRRRQRRRTAGWCTSARSRGLSLSAFPYAGMPDLVVRPAKSDLRLKIARDPPRDVCAIAMTQMPPLPGHGPHLEVHGCSSLGAVGPHDHGRVCAFPSAVTFKAAVSRAAESDCQTDRTRRLSAGLMGPAGQERLFAATIGTTGFHRTGRRVKQTNNGDLDCWTSCPLSGQNERTAHPGGASEGAGLSPDVSSPLIGRSMDRTRAPPGFHPRRFPCPAVAGVGRRARRAWKWKVALPGGLGPPACGLGNRRSVLMSYGS